MKRFYLATLSALALALLIPAAHAAATPAPKTAPTLYIAPATNGFQVSLMAAMEKKKVPVSLSTVASDAQFTLQSSPIQVKMQSTGSKFARCLFAYCAGIQDRSSVAVQLIDDKSKAVVWAYTVHKQRGGAMNDQSMAEAIAKHLKNFMEKNPGAL